MAIMGLISGKEFADNSFHSFNNRREVFHNYPNGGAPLMGLLSLMEDEKTDTALNFGWEEKRYRYPRTTTAVATSGTGSFTAASGGAAASTITLTANGTNVYYVNVADATEFQVNDSIVVLDVPMSSGNPNTVRGVITAKSTNEIAFRAINTTSTTIDNDASTVGLNVIKAGSAYGEGSRSGSGRMIVPVNPMNNTQIFKDSIEFTGTTLEIPTDFDKTGAYREKAKDASLDHMIGLEFAFLFGSKQVWNPTLAAGGSFGGSVTQGRTTGGILYFLEQWEAAGGGTAGYRPGGAALTADSDDDKRIIENSTGTMTKTAWNTYMERCFRKANNKSYEKICFCGNGALRAVDELIEKKIVRSADIGDPVERYNMKLRSVETTWGLLHFTTHPLMTDQPGLFYAMFIVDVPFLKYRPLGNRDTTLLPNRQDNDEDGKKDIWLTEAGLELRFPEAHMLIKNVQSITV